MFDWWQTPRIERQRSVDPRAITILLVGPRRFGAPVLIGSDGQVWEMHPLQYTRAWRTSYRYMREGQALVLTHDSVWPLRIDEVQSHLGPPDSCRHLSPGQRAARLECALYGARLVHGTID